MSTDLPLITNAFSPYALREMIIALLDGRNYRIDEHLSLIDSYLETYSRLYEIWQNAVSNYDIKEWPRLLESEFHTKDKYMPYWLAGLGQKMAQTIGIKQHELGTYFQRLIDHIHTINQTDLPNEQALLMLWGSVATMTLKGSWDSAKGKRLEKPFFRVIFHLLQLEEGKDYRLGIPSDMLRHRETDCEVYSKKGQIKIELTLSQKGNPESSGDKVSRLSPGDVVICDQIGDTSKIKDAIAAKCIKMIQIRHGDVVKDLYEYLKDKVDQITSPPHPGDSYRSVIAKLPEAIFMIE